MKSKVDDLSQKYLLLIKLDAKRLFERLMVRKEEYLAIFSIKRTRDHFGEIFKNRFKHLRINELVHCGEETMIALDLFYTLVDEMQWYLGHTEDMPNTVEDLMNTNIRQLEKYYNTLELHIDAELGYQIED